MIPDNGDILNLTRCNFVVWAVEIFKTDDTLVEKDSRFFKMNGCTHSLVKLCLGSEIIMYDIFYLK